MEIKQHTISISEEELDTLGIAIEMYLEKEIDCYKKIEGDIKATLQLLDEEVIDTLRGLTRCGYTMYICDDKLTDRHLTTDVDEWLDHKIKEVKKKK